MIEDMIIEFDGGSRGNPGQAAIGIVLRAPDGTPIYTLGRCIGRATNNVAEYKALIAGLSEAWKLGAKRISVRGDSELIVKQMRGEYRVRHPDMKELNEEAQFLLHRFDEAKIEHNLRNKNKLADKLLNLALDKKCDITEIDEPEIEKPESKATHAGDRFACAQCGCVVEVQRPSSIRPHQLKPFVCQCGSKMTEAPQAQARAR